MIGLFVCFISSKISGKGKRPGKGGNRFVKNIGLGFKTPREASQGLFPILVAFLFHVVQILETLIGSVCFTIDF